MQRLLLAGACWAFWLVYVLVNAKIDFRSGVFLWPAIKLAIATAVAAYVSSVVYRPPLESAEQIEEAAWRPMPLLVSVILAGAFFAGGLGIIAVSVAGHLFGAIGVVIGLACFAAALYFLFAGKYNPH